MERWPQFVFGFYEEFPRLFNGFYIGINIIVSVLFKRSSVKSEAALHSLVACILKCDM